MIIMCKLQTLYCFVILGVALVFAETGKEDVQSSKVESRHKRDLSCNRMMFEKARACCALPQMFTATSMNQCVNMTTSIFAMRMAKMNKRFKLRSQTERTKRHAGHMGPGGNRGDKFICMLKSEKLIKENGDLDVDLFTTKFNANSSSAWQSVYSKGLTDCQKEMDSANIETPSMPNMPNSTYKPKTMMLLKCIRKALFVNCPTEAINTEDSTCPASLSALSTCNPFKPKAFRMPFMGMGTRKFNPAMFQGGPGGPPPMQGSDDRIFIMPFKTQIGEDGQVMPQVMPQIMPHIMPQVMPMDQAAPEQMDPAVASAVQKPTVRRQKKKPSK